VVPVEDCEERSFWYRIYAYQPSMFLVNLCPFKTKVICIVFINADIFNLKYQPNSKKRVPNFLTQYGKSKMPTLLMQDGREMHA
jgi:hypothetical protein